jgi:quinoprotein glucose dehydrogenase
MKSNCLFFLSILSCFLLPFCTADENDNYKNWNNYGGTKEMIRYSSLNEVDTSNVSQLEVAWIFNTGDADTANHSQIQCNPIIVDGVLYGTSPQMKLFAIDAATGKQKWIYNPFDSLQGNRRTFFIMNNSRGIAYWTDGKEDKRIFYTTGSTIICIDANTGKRVNNFGDSGTVDLHIGLDRDVTDLFITASSPGIIYKDLLIMGTRVDEGPAAAPGHIRAYDVRTGKQQWIFHTVPHPGEVGYDTWEDTIAYKHIGGANTWSGFSLDEKRGILFAPTGSASFDFYGGRRKGANLFADCLLALDAATGKRLWHFQQIHHDVWDRDLPTPPALVTVTHSGKTIDAVAQPTKTGFIFLFERETGKPLFSIEEKQVPYDTELTGEKLSHTQPIPSLPKAFVRQTFSESDLNDLVPDSSYQDIKKRLQGYRHGEMYVPPSKQGTVVFPGFDGGAEWGGPAFDPSTAILYVNANEMPWVLTMVDAKNKVPENETYIDAGKRLYARHCMSCHGTERQGSGNFPSLIGLPKKYSQKAFHELVVAGRRMMPAFKQLSEEERKAIAAYLLDLKKDQMKKYKAPPEKIDSFLTLPYSITGYNKFLTKEGYPAVKPPWGTLNAINLNTGELLWKTTLGEYPEFKAKGIITGTENYGGPVVTAGGVLFIAATKDSKFRAFNKSTGKLLWETELPAPGFATPSIYSLNGKQYIVIACGGGKLGTKSSDAYVAFALPEK